MAKDEEDVGARYNPDYVRGFRAALRYLITTADAPGDGLKKANFEKVTPYGMYRCRGGCGTVMGEAFGMKVGGMRFCYECYQRLMGNVRKPERHEKDAQHNDHRHRAAI